MTRRDYEMIADAIAAAWTSPDADPYTIGLIANQFAIRLAERSIGFDELQFFKNCGVSV